jgi:Putative transposase/Transposase zinc-binding domain
MPPLRAIFDALVPESLERSPTRPTSHRKVIHAIPQCQRGSYGHSLSECPTCGGPPRVNHSCGNRHCPQCQQHTTQQWRAPPLDKQLPGPHFLLTCTVPETLRPFSRSPQRLAYHAMCHASSLALKRLATDARFIGTDLPGCTGVLHPWGRQLQSPPHSHSIVPGGGLSAARSAWVPSRANFFVPVKALSPLSRALCKEDMRHASLLEQIAPPAWTLPWNVHSQADHHSHSAVTSLAPSVFRGAISNRRIVDLKDRTVTCTSRTGGSARPRTPPLDAIECIRRVLPPGLPDGFRKVRHCGCLPARCALPLATIRLMIGQGQSREGKPMRIIPPPPRVALCPACGAPMRVVMRLWTSPKDFVDTS